MAKATGLISLLFNIALSGDVPFHQPQWLQCLHHGSTETYLCSPLSSIPLSTATYTKVTICGTRVMALVVGKCRALRTLLFAWNFVQHIPRARCEMKHSDTP